MRLSPEHLDTRTIIMSSIYLNRKEPSMSLDGTIVKKIEPTIVIEQPKGRGAVRDKKGSLSKKKVEKSTVTIRYV